ncbi:MAG: BlaI/MecI/CopY family transcriptional regulator, partial [Pseudomonadota bacterium]
DAPLSARQIHDGPGVDLGWSLSSTRTTLARMVSKGLLEETSLKGVRAYKPTQSKARTVAGLMRRFFGRVLEIEGPLPTSAFMGGTLLSDAELEEIDRLLAEPDTDELDTDGAGQ